MPPFRLFSHFAFDDTLTIMFHFHHVCIKLISWRFTPTPFMSRKHFCGRYIRSSNQQVPTHLSPFLVLSLVWVSPSDGSRSTFFAWVIFLLLSSGQPPLGLENFPQKFQILHFFSFQVKKNLIGWVKKIPSSKTGWSLISNIYSSAILSIHRSLLILFITIHTMYLSSSQIKLIRQNDRHIISEDSFFIPSVFERLRVWYSH